MPSPPEPFEGFRPEAITFLADLAWFTPRKDQYETLLRRPLEALYRDVRFSRDKSPHHDKVRTGGSAGSRVP